MSVLSAGTVAFGWWAVALGLCGVFWGGMWRAGASRTTLFLLIPALALYVLHIALTTWNAYTNDPLAHAEYVWLIAQHGGVPQLAYEANKAFHHPPLFYWLSAKVFAAVSSADEAFAWQYARLVSFGFYLVFLGFAVMLLRAVIRAPLAYYTALCVLLFWPLGITMPGRITVDIPLFACMMAMIYCLFRFIERYEARFLACALVALGVGFFFKSAMGVMLFFTVLMIALLLLLRRLQWKNVVARSVCFSGVFALLCYKISSFQSVLIGRIPDIKDTFLYGAGNFSGAFQGFDYNEQGELVRKAGIACVQSLLCEWQNILSVLKFDLILFLTSSIFRPISYIETPPFLNLFFRSLLLDQFWWLSEMFVLFAAVLMLAMMVYAAISLPWCAVRDACRRAPMLLALTLMAAFWASMAYMYVRYAIPHSANARYFYPFIVLFALLYGTAMQFHAQQGRALLARFGAVVATLFVIASLLMYAAQHVKPLRIDLSEYHAVYPALA